MKFIPIKTRTLRPPKDDIYKLLENYLPRLRDQDILVITSKILGIHQGRCVKIQTDSPDEKNRLIMQEAEWYVPPASLLAGGRRAGSRHGVHWHLTIKNHTLIADAGIDKSNGRGYYILWPKRPQKLLKEIRAHLMKKFQLKKLGVMAIDSHLIPLRTGTLSLSTGFAGFEPLRDYRGKPDIFGRELKFTRRNVVDSLAAVSGLLTGEGNEQTPLLIIRDAKFVKFTNQNVYRKLVFPLQKDIYRPLLKVYRKNLKYRP